MGAGAIMFNDELSLDDCEALVSRLSKCALPFQCAHGRYAERSHLPLLREAQEFDIYSFRPSLVPLVDLASTMPALRLTSFHDHTHASFLSGSRTSTQGSSADEGFIAGFKKWERPLTREVGEVDGNTNTHAS